MQFQNHMKEALILFDALTNSYLLSDSTIFFLFTKLDIFKEKIVSGLKPVTKYFPSYKGGATDVAAVREFFTNQFKNVAPASREIFIHHIDATDTGQVKTVLDSVREVIERKRGELSGE
jgi:guanine nucleotide-binding protein subunit alpha, other